MSMYSNTVTAHSLLRRHLDRWFACASTGLKKCLTQGTTASIFRQEVTQLPNLDHLSHAEKDALIRALWQRLEAAERRIAELEARLAEPGKTLDNSSLP